jgi:uncharacterized protein YggL (DUF469 family)
MKKRLRKKLRVKEFFDVHMEITGKFGAPMSETAMDMLMDNICHFVDENGMEYWGSMTPTEFSHVISGLHFWKDRLTEEKIKKYFDRWYKNAFISGEHTVVIHRATGDEIFTFKGWC